MSALSDRLRDVVRPAERRGGPSGPSDDRPPVVHDAAADVLDGEWRESRGQRFLVIDRKYSPGYRHGHVAMADVLPPPDEVWPRLSLLAEGCRGRMLFVDLETTGLAGGAGTYAFLVGCAWFEPPSPEASAGQAACFRIRQFFLASFGAERALLEAVADMADAAGTVVTYNGKSFDLPLLDTRYVMHRMETPFAGMPHVDMLHPARRLWKTEEECRLSVIEAAQCGHAREGDVPGFEIPARYFHYVRSGDARRLEAVMEHNRLDLLSLALVTARAAQLLDEGPVAARSAREALGIGRIYERAGLIAEASASFDRASAMPDADGGTRAEALRSLAVLLRRQRRFEQAAAAWREMLGVPGCPDRLMREATEALAVHHEHRLRDPRAARVFALQSMEKRTSAARREALEYRLARLNRKLGDAESAALF